MARRDRGQDSEDLILRLRRGDLELRSLQVQQPGDRLVTKVNFNELN